jgi:hypothetical protein
MGLSFSPIYPPSQILTRHSSSSIYFAHFPGTSSLHPAFTTATWRSHKISHHLIQPSSYTNIVQRLNPHKMSADRSLRTIQNTLHVLRTMYLYQILELVLIEA